MVQNELIFISIASYRDIQLVPTVEDLLLKAEQPSLLRFGICWQHDPADPPLPFAEDVQFRVLDIDWRHSRGACWARAEIMKLWQGEQYFLQVDSHCRFSQGWDTTLIRMMAQTGSLKPLLSTYAFPFDPLPPGSKGVEHLAGEPQMMAIETFAGAEGIPQLKPLSINDYAKRTRPMHARFLAAGFLFAPGEFVEEVPYDPELYFFGEEISMTLRAYTAGYDLFHPVEQVVWHDYVRTYAIRHWENHDKATTEDEAAPTFHDLDRVSKQKIHRLLHPGEGTEGPDLGCFGLGAARSLADYERFAGLSFAQRKIQDYTRCAYEPPNPALADDWTERIYTWMVRVVVEPDALPQVVFAGKGFWVMSIQDEDGREIHRRDWTREQLEEVTDASVRNVLVTEMEAGVIPVSWSLWPYSRVHGWMNRITGTLGEDDFAIVTD